MEIVSIKYGRGGSRSNINQSSNCTGSRCIVRSKGIIDDGVVARIKNIQISPRNVDTTKAVVNDVDIIAIEHSQSVVKRIVDVTGKHVVRYQRSSSEGGGQILKRYRFAVGT